MKKDSLKNSEIFWRFFWITVFILALLYALVVKSASEKTNKISENEIAAIKEMLIKKEPEIEKLLETSAKNLKKEIEKTISSNIDKAFEPLYKQIDNFANFHYSVTGEYTELASLLLKKTDYAVREYLIKPANFRKNLNEALENIKKTASDLTKKETKKTNEEIEKLLNSENENDTIVSKLLSYEENKVFKRFENEYANLFRAGGTVTAALGAKALSKALCKKITAKILAKTALKTGTKTGAKIAGIGAGAASGAEVGSLLGPAGAAIGGVVGAIAGWIATDKIVIETDKFLNEEEFKKDIKNMIDEEKEKMKKRLYKRYSLLTNRLEKERRDSLKELKKKRIKDILSR